MGEAQLSFLGQAVMGAKPFSGQYIYETRGRAREYRELACNLYSGCDHRCTYCWAPDVVHRDRETFQVPSPRADVLRKLEAEAIRYGKAGEKRQVLFCFTCDPYQKEDERYGLTRSAIEICHRNGLAACTLTKGGSRAMRDIDLFTASDSFAVTLTLLDDKASLEWEPGAALPGDRMDMLQAFHARGIPTWVSLEPVIDPEATMEIIRQTHGYVDEFKVGTLNYHPRGKEIDWPKFAREVQGLLDGLGCRYYLKQDLRKYL